MEHRLTGPCFALAGQGHMTMSIIKIGGSTKWLPEMERACTGRRGVKLDCKLGQFLPYTLILLERNYKRFKTYVTR